MAATSAALAAPDQTASLQLAPLPDALARIFNKRESYADVAFVADADARVLYAHQGRSDRQRGSRALACSRTLVFLPPYRCAGLLAVRSSAQFRQRYLAPPRLSAPPAQPPYLAFAGRVVAVDEQEVPFTVLSHLVQYMYTNELHHVTNQDELDQLFKVARCGRITQWVRDGAGA